MSAFLGSPDVRVHPLDIIGEDAWRIPAPKLIHICHNAGTRCFFVDTFKRLALQPVYELSDDDVRLIQPIYVPLTRPREQVETY